MSPNLNLSECVTPRRLQRARKLLELTQSELGAALGVSKAEIWKKEHGQRPVSIAQSLAIECLLRRANLWCVDFWVD